MYFALRVRPAPTKPMFGWPSPATAARFLAHRPARPTNIMSMFGRPNQAIGARLPAHRFLRELVHIRATTTHLRTSGQRFPYTVSMCRPSYAADPPPHHSQGLEELTRTPRRVARAPLGRDRAWLDLRAAAPRARGAPAERGGFVEQGADSVTLVQTLAHGRKSMSGSWSMWQLMRLLDGLFACSCVRGLACMRPLYSMVCAFNLVCGCIRLVCAPTCLCIGACACARTFACVAHVWACARVPWSRPLGMLQLCTHVCMRRCTHVCACWYVSVCVCVRAIVSHMCADCCLRVCMLVATWQSPAHVQIGAAVRLAVLLLELLLHSYLGSSVGCALGTAQRL